MGRNYPIMAVATLALAGLSAFVIRIHAVHEAPVTSSKRDSIQASEHPEISDGTRINALLAALDKAAKAGLNADIRRICRDLYGIGDPVLPHAEKLLLGPTYGRMKLALLTLLGDMASKGSIELLEKFSSANANPSEEWLVLNALRILKGCAPDRYAELVKAAEPGQVGYLQMLADKLAKAEGMSVKKNPPASRTFRYLAPEQCESEASLKSVLQGDGRDEVKVEAVEVLAEKYPGTCEAVLASYVEKNSDGNQWPVSKAIALLINADSKGRDSRIKEMVRTGSEELVGQILKVLLNSKSESKREILGIIVNRFDNHNVLHMRAGQALDEIKRVK